MHTKGLDILMEEGVYTSLKEFTEGQCMLSRDIFGFHYEVKRIIVENGLIPL